MYTDDRVWLMNAMALYHYGVAVCFYAAKASCSALLGDEDTRDDILWTNLLALGGGGHD
jgi:hypothetical protein